MIIISAKPSTRIWGGFNVFLKVFILFSSIDVKLLDFKYA
ncbi:hypothetical protein Bsph_3723 [Lysinibacillus sphaericus C3-41]|uniref:Uncharacterized protein n=1 Tax=Lysinibacillus sphaericus (strain C3-41) TaxID=444177 RepID=B1HTK3_LYSSC|nr:hypothetical protein Bsph_3723 [Lysinibacillus sphaericus C3-41]